MASAKTLAQLTAKERAKRPNLRAEYGRKLQAVTPGAYEFRLQLIRPGARAIVITNVVTAFSWADESAKLTGAMTVQRTEDTLAQIGPGHRIRCSVRAEGGYLTVWEMGVKEPTWDRGARSGDFDLEDDLALLDHVRMDWSFRKTKRRGKGWYAHEIAAEVARRSGIKVLRLARGTKRIDKLVKKNATALDVIREAYAKEREHSKQRFILRLNGGKIDVIALSRNGAVYELDDQVTGAVVTAKRSSRPTTVIRGRGRVGKGKGARKVKYTRGSAAASRRLGKTVKETDYGKVDSEAELRFKVNRDLAKALRVTRGGSLEAPGIPHLRRGDVLRWITDEPGWNGSTSEIRDRSFVFATSVNHQVTSSQYTMSLEVIQEDPYVKASAERDKEMRAAVRARKKTKTKAKK